MNRMLAMTTSLLLSMVAAACAPQLRSNIAVFHSLPQQAANVPYAFMPLKDQDAAYENLAYRNGIKEELLRRGYRETTSEEASLVVAFSHSIDSDHVQPAGQAGAGEEQDYTRKLWVYIMEKGALNGDSMRVLYEGNVITFGTPSLLGSAVPSMIKELFRDFPGRSGTVRTEYITIN